MVLVVTHLCVTGRIATRLVELLLVSVYLLTPHKRPGTAIPCAMILKSILLECHHPGSQISGQACPRIGIKSYCLMSGGSVLLAPARKPFVLKKHFFTNVFFKHRWYHANRNRDGKALVQAWNAFIHNVECILIEELGWTNLMQLASGSNSETQPVLDTDCTSFQERQGFPISRG